MEKATKDNPGCLDFELTQEQLQKLDEINRIELGFRMIFCFPSLYQNIVYGGLYR